MFQLFTQFFVEAIQGDDPPAKRAAESASDPLNDPKERDAFIVLGREDEFWQGLLEAESVFIRSNLFTDLAKKFCNIFRREPRLHCQESLERRRFGNRRTELHPLLLQHGEEVLRQYRERRALPRPVLSWKHVLRTPEQAVAAGHPCEFGQLGRPSARKCPLFIPLVVVEVLYFLVAPAAELAESVIEPSGDRRSHFRGGVRIWKSRFDVEVPERISATIRPSNFLRSQELCRKTGFPLVDPVPHRLNCKCALGAGRLEERAPFSRVRGLRIFQIRRGNHGHVRKQACAALSAYIGLRQERGIDRYAFPPVRRLHEHSDQQVVASPMHGPTPKRNEGGPVQRR